MTDKKKPKQTPDYIQKFLYEVNKAGQKLSKGLEADYEDIALAKAELEFVARPGDIVELEIDDFLDEARRNCSEFARALESYPQQIQNWRKSKAKTVVRWNKITGLVEIVRKEQIEASCRFDEIGDFR